MCPSARSFNPQNGPLEDQVARALKASQIFGAKCMRCILGGDPERPQIEMHIDNMIVAVRTIRPRIVGPGTEVVPLTFSHIGANGSVTFASAGGR